MVLLCLRVRDAELVPYASPSNASKDWVGSISLTRSPTEEDDSSASDVPSALVLLPAIPAGVDLWPILDACGVRSQVDWLQTIREPDITCQYAGLIGFASEEAAISFCAEVRCWEWLSCDGGGIKALFLHSSSIEPLPSDGKLFEGGVEEWKEGDGNYSRRTHSFGDLRETAEERFHSSAKSVGPRPSAWPGSPPHLALDPPVEYMHYENAALQLPTCAVCMDRLNPSIYGLHVSRELDLSDSTQAVPRLVQDIVRRRRGHGPGSLRMWVGSNCRVCQASQLAAEGVSLMCEHEGCGICHNLWACMSCGHIGCGRYTREHAKGHFGESGHAYSLELSTGRVWNYRDDCFVHRILHSSDGTWEGDDDDPYGLRSLGIELTSKGLSGESRHDGVGRSLSAGAPLQQKLALVVSEYETLLADQLREQAVYYEELIARMIAVAAEERAAEGEGFTATEEAEVEALRREVGELHRVHEERLGALREAQERMRRLREDNAGMIRQQRAEKDNIARLHQQAQEVKERGEQSVAELTRQVQDLTFYLR
jgi:hypothetical protein